jgi:hypothetical protein
MNECLKRVGRVWARVGRVDRLGLFLDFGEFGLKAPGSLGFNVAGHHLALRHA